MKRSGRPQREEKKGLKWRGHTESLWVWEKHISICNHLCSVTLLILRCDIGQYTVYTRLLQCLFKPTQRGDQRGETGHNMETGVENEKLQHRRSAH